jgi:hypothetical protein
MNPSVAVAAWALAGRRRGSGTLLDDADTGFTCTILLAIVRARTRAVIVAAVMRAASVAVVAVAAWASGGMAPELSSDVTSLPDFGVSYDPAFESTQPLSPAPSAVVRPRAFAVQNSSYLQ